MPPAVLVTGGNKGIGLAIVQGLVEKGYTVFLGSRDVGRGEAAKELIGEAGKELVKVVQLDVSADDSVKKALADVTTALGGTPLSGLINNAGGVVGLGMGFSTAENFVGTMELNYLHSAVRVTEAFLPLLDQENGRIVNVASGAAPSYVGKCSAARQAALCDWDTTTMEG